MWNNDNSGRSRNDVNGFESTLNKWIFFFAFFHLRFIWIKTIFNIIYQYNAEVSLTQDDDTISFIYSYWKSWINYWTLRYASFSNKIKQETSKPKEENKKKNMTKTM